MKKHWHDNPRSLPESENCGAKRSEPEDSEQKPEQAPVPVRVPAAFAVGGVEVRPATVLAPMAGVTDTIFRRFIRNASLFTPPATRTPPSTMRFPISSPAAGSS